MKQTMIATISLLALIAAPAPAAAGQSTNHAQIYITAKDTGQRLAHAGDVVMAAGLPVVEKDEYIFVDPAKTFQTFLGIGGALTDASAETFYKLPTASQQELLQAYFDPQAGIGYTLGRTHIHSCDFSSESYTYVKDGDQKLDSFDISHDLKYRIPFIKAALAKAGPQFTLYASPWSPPAWMKDNNNMLHGGKLKPEDYEPWARYFGKFIQAYEKAGVPIWGVTVQNEPLASQTWESCIYTAEEERDFIKNHLGPALRDAGLQDKKLIIWDHNRSFLYPRASAVLDDPDAAKYVWGVGFHWYVDDDFDNVKQVKEAYPQTHLLFTEGCNAPFEAGKINDWNWGEAYGKSMIHDFNNGTEGWTDWNVLLDEKGGPNHVQNFCFAPVHADTRTGKLTYMNSYYYIGHLSKFIRPGAKRIMSSSTTDKLLTTAFLNPDGTIAVVVLNLSGQPVFFNVSLGGQATRINSPARSIITVVI
jgi:glucosylceramidase